MYENVTLVLRQAMLVYGMYLTVTGKLPVQFQGEFLEAVMSLVEPVLGLVMMAISSGWTFWKRSISPMLKTEAEKITELKEEIKEIKEE